MIACVVVPMWLQDLLMLGVGFLFGWPIALACIRWAIKKNQKLSKEFDGPADHLSEVAVNNGCDIVMHCVKNGGK